MDWPLRERPHLAGVPGWMTAALATREPVTGPAATLWVKSWGVTALFEADGEPVVFKDASPALFPQAASVYRLLNRVVPSAAPALLAEEDFPGYSWSVFGYVHGQTVKDDGSPRAVRAMAERLAQVQAAVATDEGLAAVPGYDVASLPERFAADLTDQPGETRRRLDRALPWLSSQAAELATAVPRSLDHPDMNVTNGIVSPGSEVVVLDWEEASVGCPLFSVDRLTDRDSLAGQDAADVVDAYLGALPWADLAGLRHAYALAHQLVPLQRAAEARAFARALGRQDPHTRLTGVLIDEALRRCQTARTS
jgi:aminoglycoside phosphotransferase (APT) family kinase protein